ncbi:hypothetical protein [Cellulomonas humilata]|uniref:Uncharacterized protein n=1 Tax=Cellulomonas humilata TaxID=144055 RepID=A0ABU0EL87_9CELL|nr:hypothetical protein [Cellulomonas humilata]MDQ0375954.1 hypothetical protein [Cellulomonas humilata]
MALVALTAFAGLVVLWMNAEGLEASALWMEVAKALITIIGVAFIGGIVKLLMEQHVREREEHLDQIARRQRDQQGEHAFVHEAIAELEDIRSRLENARILIEAHRSATSYRDRMQDVILSRVRLNALGLRFAARWGDAAKPYLQQLHAADEYLAGLIWEYRDRYRDVANAQRLDEALADETFKAYARSFATWPPPPSYPAPPPNLNLLAWQLLGSEDQLPRLHDYRSAGRQYLDSIPAMCGKLASSLRSRLNADA